ncbi:MAG: hypothetical protein FGF50_10500 [Candidatus Brockarchaeota archaeon]|nr:hypothetical protein [Candidatus Brockarchaeota archaeon]
MNHRNFIALALASLLISLLSLLRDLAELWTFINFILLSSLLLFVMLFITRKYWRDARSVS